MTATFYQLNEGWNAEPNAPNPSIQVEGEDLVLTFRVNPFQFPEFEKGEVGILRFKRCERYRVGPPMTLVGTRVDAGLARWRRNGESFIGSRALHHCEKRWETGDRFAQPAEKASISCSTSAMTRLNAQPNGA